MLLVKKLWRQQHDLEANGYRSQEECLSAWRESRSGEFFVIGSRDETAGCQLCVATVAEDGSFTLRFRMPDSLPEQHGKYLLMEGVRFAYGLEQVLAAVLNNADRTAGVGQPISYRFKRDAKVWRVFVSTEMMEVPVVTEYREGVEIKQVNPACSSVIGWVKLMGRYGLSGHQAAALVLARRLLRFSERIPRRRVCPVGNGRHVAFDVPVRNRVKHVWTYWNAISRKLRPALAAPRRLGTGPGLPQSGPGCQEAMVPPVGLGMDLFGVPGRDSRAEPSCTIGTAARP